MADENSFLGRGWSFPPSFTYADREIIMLDGEEDIDSSLQILLSTRIGERIMQPLYGCNLDISVFDSLDTTLKTEIRTIVETAILYFEPRINVEKIDVLTQNELNGMLLITVDYVVRNTNTRRNLVFPFYLLEK